MFDNSILDFLQIKMIFIQDLPRMDKIVCYAPDRRVEIEVVGGKPHG